MIETGKDYAKDLADIESTFETLGEIDKTVAQLQVKLDKLEMLRNKLEELGGRFVVEQRQIEVQRVYEEAMDKVKRVA